LLFLFFRASIFSAVDRKGPQTVLELPVFFKFWLFSRKNSRIPTFGPGGSLTMIFGAEVTRLNAVRHDAKVPEPLLAWR
jgi:hypothetical protein